MKAKNALLLVLTSAAAGMIAGLLLAPGEGSATRKKWMKKARKYKKQLGDKATEYKERASDLKDNIEGAVQDVKKRFSHS